MATVILRYIFCVAEWQLQVLFQVWHFFVRSWFLFEFGFCFSIYFLKFVIFCCFFYFCLKTLGLVRIWAHSRVTAQSLLFSVLRLYNDEEYTHPHFFYNLDFFNLWSKLNWCGIKRPPLHPNTFGQLGWDPRVVHDPLLKR